MHSGNITFLYFKRIQKVLTKTIPRIEMFPNQIHTVKMKIEIVEVHKPEVFYSMTQTLILAHFRWARKDGGGYDSQSP